MMEYCNRMKIGKDTAEKLTRYLNAKPSEYPDIIDRQGGSLFDEESVFKTKDGKTVRMAIMVIAPTDEESTAWAQAVLYDENGGELGFTDPEYEILGEWELESGDDVFTVIVENEKR